MNEPVQLPAGTDVLIIGTGAVGLTLAASRASAGVLAVLADKQAEGAHTSPACVDRSRTPGVTATMAGGETIRAGYVVGAHGMHSTVRELDWVPAVHHTLAMKLSELSAEPHHVAKN